MSKSNPAYKKNSQVGFAQLHRFNVRKLINSPKKKKVVMSVETEKACGNIQYPLTIKKENSQEIWSKGGNTSVL